MVRNLVKEIKDIIKHEGWQHGTRVFFVSDRQLGMYGYILEISDYQENGFRVFDKLRTVANALKIKRHYKNYRGDIFILDKDVYVGKYKNKDFFMLKNKQILDIEEMHMYNVKDSKIIRRDMANGYYDFSYNLQDYWEEHDEDIEWRKIQRFIAKNFDDKKERKKYASRLYVQYSDFINYRIAEVDLRIDNTNKVIKFNEDNRNYYIVDNSIV